MDTKTKNITIAVIAAAVIGGLYLGYNRWRQERLARQVINGLYGINSGNVAGGLAERLSNGVSDKVASEIAKGMIEEQARQKEEEAREAAKTPEDKFNETKEAAVVGEMLPAMASEIKPAMEAVFEKVKVTSYGTGYMGDLNKSFTAAFKVPRVVVADDLSQLSSNLAANGYKSIGTSAENDSGALSLMKGEAISLSFSYDNNGTDQEVIVTYMDLATE